MASLHQEESEWVGDAKYRAYVAAVEKALKNFEYSSEWADLISALGKLNKVLQANSKYPVIPKRLLIGKRLAQCTHPALPSGVHLRALETYDIIFKNTGSKRLAQDLFLYSAGLFPLLGNAAMSVKPVLLSLYEEHYLPLGEHLKPGLNGLLLGILPGLEEGSEYYERTNSLLEQVCGVTDRISFHTALWDCVLSSPMARLPAITFVLSYVSKSVPLEGQLYFMGNDTNRMVTAISASLHDSSVLVQRSMLDFLLQCLPMHAARLEKEDTINVVMAALNVVLRRDMSLNRRLYAWLLGGDSNSISGGQDYHPRLRHADSISSSITTISEEEASYFDLHSKEFLIESLKLRLHDDELNTAWGSGGEKIAALKPYRILISLLDKPEIGAAILEDILIEVFRSLYLHCLSSNVEQEKSARKRRPKSRRQRRSKEEKGSSELIKTANLLFSTFEPFFLWDYIARQFDACCRLKRVMSDEDSIAHGKVTVRELCKLVDFLLDVVSLETYMETQTEHLPELLCQITMSMSNHCLVLDVTDINAGLNLCAKILTKVLPSMATTPADGGITQSGEFQEAATATLESSVREAKVMQVADEETVDEKPSEAVVLETPVASPDEEILEEIKEETREINGENGDDDSTTVGDEEKFDPEQLEEDEIPIDRMDETNVSWNDTDSSRDGSKISSKDGKEFVNQAMQSTEDAIMKAGKITPIANAAQDGEEEGEESESESESETEEESQSESSATMSGQSGEPSEKGEQEAASTMNVAEQEKEQTPLFLMQACMQCYQNCFAKFITTKILPCSEIVGTCMEYITTSEAVRLDGSSLPKPHIDAFITACQLLVEFSCFPLYCDESVTASQLQEAINKDGTSLPEWLQALITCSCFVSNFEIQSTAAATMLDLINLTRSVAIEPSGKSFMPSPPSSPPSTGPGKVAVVIVPAIAQVHLDYITENTMFFQLVARNLWGWLSAQTPQYHQKTADLFYQLHSVAPSMNICEDVIGRSLLHEDKAVSIEGHVKFALLWHLIRGRILSVSPSTIPRTFDRSMLNVLDHLYDTDSITKAVVTTWLTHAIERGDIARILEPMLLILLHPKTARVSVQFLRLNSTDALQAQLHIQNEEERAKDDAYDAAERRIRGIANVDGEISYFVEKDGTQALMRNMEKQVPVFAMTSIDGRAKYITKTNKTTPYRVPADSEIKTMSVIVNPFGSQHSLSSDSGSEYSSQAAASSATGSKVKRVAGSSESLPEDGASTTARGETDDPESIYGGAMFEPEAYSYSVSESPEEIARAIVNDMINVAVPVKDIIDGKEMDERELKDEDTTVSRTTEMDSHIDDDYHGHSADDEAGDEFEWDNFETKLSELDTEHSDPDSPRRHISMASLTSDTKRALNSVHPLHQHMLMYKQVYDSRRSIYVLTALRNILQVIPRTFVCAASSTSISSIHTPHLATLQNLLARHRRSIVGKSFYDDLPQEALASFRSNTYLEIMVSVCMYFIRGYYPKYMPATSDDIRGNKDVQILSIEIMTKILAELVQVVKESGKGTATFIKDLMSRCKVQKAILHCLLATVLNARKQALRQYSAGFNMSDKSSQAVQIHLLQLVLTVMVLEEQLFSLKDGSDRSPTDNEGIGEWEHVRPNFQQPMSSLRFIQSERVASQGMFLCAILSALRQPHMSHVHRQWVSIVTDGLPYMDKGLGNIVVPVANQLCKNLESLAYLYDRNGGFQRDKRPMTKLEYIPPDHAVTLLEGLTTMCHYCLLESTTNLSAVSSRHGVTTSASDTESVNPAQLLSNLFGALSGDKHKGAAASTSTQSANPVTEARKGLLGILPRIMSAVAVLWSAITTCENEESRSGSYQREAKKANWVIGTPRAVRQQILEFLSPIALHHGINLLGAIGVVWSDRRKLNRPVVGTRKVIVIPQANEEQTLLVELVSAIKAMPTDTVIQTIRHVMKGPPYTIKDKNQPSLEVNILQFFYQFVQRSSSSQLLDSWQTLLSLLRESLQLNLPPTGQFLLFGILNEFIMKLTGFADRKYQKDLQEIAQKLIENIYHIAGSSLGQTRWLRRQRSVIPIPQDGYIEDLDLEESLPAPQIEISTTKSGRHDVPPPTSASSSPTTQVAFSVQALTLLAENLSIMLDIIYGSEEKEKVVPLLTQIMQNVTPYLRNHSSANMPAFRSCVSLLSSLSGYQYTRKAWRKDTIELLMDQSFFQMDAICINGFRSIIDNLMTHDKTTYRDLMSKVAAINNSTSLNLFTNKEQEMDQRAQLLKRLSFSIFCSEVDQYQKFLPDIQERLVENLRLTNVPNVHEQVFMCFRVLLLRMSPQHLTGLWPTMISEMVQVFLHIEEQLFGGGENTGRPKDAPIFPILNGSPTIYQKQWLGLYLSACKLLDLALVLPVENMPQFQLYKWAFIGDNSGLDMLKKQFVPHIARLAHLINKKLDNTEELTLIKSIPGRPLLTMYSIKSIGQLQQFFNTLCHIHQLGGSLASLSLSQSSTALQESQQLSQSQDRPYRHIRRDSITSVTSKADDHESRSSTSPMQFIERMIERDFLDPLVQ